MRIRILSLLLSCLVLITSGCGFHLRGTTEIPQVFKTLNFDANDPYGPLARAVRTELRLNNIEIDSKDTNSQLPSLRLLDSREDSKTISVYRNGATAEYQMLLTVSAQVLMPNQDLYPMQVKIYRTFFDNPRAALAKDAEQEMIKEEMHQQAAQQLVRKLLAVAAADTKTP